MPTSRHWYSDDPDDWTDETVPMFVQTIITYPDVDDSGGEDREDRMKWWMEREDAWEEEEQP